MHVKEDKINKEAGCQEVAKVGHKQINSIDSVRAERNSKVLFLGSKAVSVGLVG
jgi:hypothetical protein